MLGSRKSAAATVRAALRARGWQQADLGAVIGKSQATVSSRLAGSTPFTLDELDKVAAWLHVTVTQLLEPPALLVDDDESEGGDQGA